jgi:hypothetical protein
MGRWKRECSRKALTPQEVHLRFSLFRKDLVVSDSKSYVLLTI